MNEYHGLSIKAAVSEIWPVANVCPAESTVMLLMNMGLNSPAKSK